MATRTLTDAQFDLLRRVAGDGQPLSRDESGVANSVYALRSRGLVTTPTQSAYWRAAVTDRGHLVLAQGDVAAANRLLSADSRGASSPRRRDPTIEPAELVERVVAAGGTLHIPEPLPEDRRAYRRAIHAANAARLAGPGQLIRHNGRAHGDLVLWVVAEPDEATPTLVPAPIPVPERLVRPHPLISAARGAAKRGPDGMMDTRHVDGAAHLRVAPPSLPRALLLLQALANEATRRGHSVELLRGHGCAGGFAITVQGHPFEVVVIEETERAVHVPTASELRQKERNQWARIPEWDTMPTGRLRMQLGHHHYGGMLAADRVRWNLADRLGQVLATLELRGQEAEARRIADEERRADRRRARQAAMAEAELQLIKAHRAEHLGTQLRRWQEAAAIRAMIATVAANEATEPHSDWIEWARRYANEIDPSVTGLTPPPAPKITPETLRPFLGRWSPHGPDG